MFLLFTFMVVSAVSGCTTGSGTVLRSVEDNGPSKMSMSYEKFTGYKQTHITVKDEPVVVAVEIETESGILDAYIAIDNDILNTSYLGHDIPTTSFTVTLSEPGYYTVRVDAENHSGSYSFTWK